MGKVELKLEHINGSTTKSIPYIHTTKSNIIDLGSRLREIRVEAFIAGYSYAINTYSLFETINGNTTLESVATQVMTGDAVLNEGVFQLYSVLDIAEWFLHKEKMTHKKLQKLCYYAYAWNYTLKGTQLFNDTKFQAWVHGPVSPALYKKYAGNGWNELSPSEMKPYINKSTEEVLESVWETYGELTGNSLEALTHSEPPWIKIRFGLNSNDPSDGEINDDDVKEYYSSIYEGGEE